MSPTVRMARTCTNNSLIIPTPCNNWYGSSNSSQEQLLQQQQHEAIRLLSNCRIRRRWYVYFVSARCGHRHAQTTLYITYRNYYYCRCCGGRSRTVFWARCSFHRMFTWADIDAFANAKTHVCLDKWAGWVKSKPVNQFSQRADGYERQSTRRPGLTIISIGGHHAYCWWSAASEALWDQLRVHL